VAGRYRTGTRTDRNKRGEKNANYAKELRRERIGQEKIRKER
jgi:hypothetical protein